MKLIDNPLAALRHYSTFAMTLGVGLQGLWMAYPDDLKTALGADAVLWVARVTAIVLIAGLVGKVIDQTPKDTP